MGIVATYYPATRLLSWDVGADNIRGARVDTVNGGVLITGEAGIFRRYSVAGSLVKDMQLGTSVKLFGVTVASDGTIYVDVDTSGVPTINRYSSAGSLMSTKSRPGYSSFIGDVTGKICMGGGYLYIPMTQAENPWQIWLSSYNLPAITLKYPWIVTWSDLVHSAVSGLYVNSTNEFLYASFLDRGVVVKFQLHTSGGLIYLVKVWQYGIVDAGTIVGPTGICVDETNSFVYVVRLGEPYNILVLDASTGALLWTWDSYHNAGAKTLEFFGQNSEVVIDANNDIYVVGLGGAVIKLKGFYDPATHEVFHVQNPDATQLWKYRFGPL